MFKILTCSLLQSSLRAFKWNNDAISYYIYAIISRKTLPQLKICENQTRKYANKIPSKKDSKSKKGGAKLKVQLTDEEMLEVINVNAYRNLQEKLLEKLRNDFTKHLNLRTQSNIDVLTVEYEGENYPLNELAQVTKKNPQLVVVNMTSFPQAITAVLDAINKSGLNLNPQQDGTTIYIPTPLITKEYRESLVKSSAAMLNKTKEAIRDLQNRFIKDAKKKTDISADLQFNVQQQIMAIAEGFIEQAEKLTHVKQSELRGTNL